jgi:hypothetical protein
MARTDRITIEFEDVNGSFARMIREAPKVAREYLSRAVTDTTLAVRDRMEKLVPVDEGDLYEAIDVRVPRKTGLMGRAGVFDNPELVSRALFNEYIPNKQPFMRPAAVDEANAFEARARKALQQMEAALSRGV